MMKRMKTILTIMLALMLALCASGLAEAAAPRVIALKGPTAMGLVKLMNDAEAGGEWQFDIVSAVDEVAPRLVKGEADIACVPANLASVLYNNTEGQVQALAINTLGVLYIVENGDSVHEIGDLAGRTLYASGKGATPEYALNHILSANGLDPEKDVTVEWKSEHAECLNALLAGEGGIAMLPQPFVTTAMLKAEGLRVAVDLNAAWDALDEGSSLITGVAVVRRAFAEANPEAVNAFLDAYGESVAWVNANVDEAAALIGGYDIVPEPVAKVALPQCNIVFIEGAEMADRLSGYLSVLLAAEPKSVGGKLPEADFYYTRER